ncbi:hypothetical protein BH10PSE4_BH10PSE4_44550 [soil metagenome]
MKTAISKIAIAAATVTLIAAPSLASAAHRHHDRDRYQDRRYEQSRYDSCRSDRKHSGNTGTVVGALGGALVGNSLSHGNKTGGTLLGAGVGALAGHQIGKSSKHC